MKRVAILQSNYIPWKGYFDLLAKADVFVVYDEVQYTKNDWRNRNQIKTKQGKQWITIPARNTRLDQTISETKVANRNWKKKHLGQLQANYAKANCFKEVKEEVFSWYGIESDMLSEINVHFMKKVMDFLEIKTQVVDSRELCLEGDRNERLIDACKKLGGECYLSGPAAKSYIDENAFQSDGIKVEWVNYDGYPEYEQPHPPFDDHVTILDLLFSVGKEARGFIKN